MPFVPAQGRSKAAEFGTLLGKGVGSGINEQISNNLHQLAQQKLQTMHRKNQASAWQKVLGISPENAYELTALPYETQLSLLENPAVLARLRGQQAQQNPAQMFNAQPPSPYEAQYQPQQQQLNINGLDLLAKQAGISPQDLQDLATKGGVNLQELAQIQPLLGQMPLEQPMEQMQPRQAAANIPQNIPQQMAPAEKLNLRSKALTPLQQEQLRAAQGKRAEHEQKNIEETKLKRSKLEDFVETTRRALKTLSSGKVSFGNPIYAGLTSNQYTAGLVPESTESFATDANHLYNLKTEGLKGIMSKHRLQVLASDKPGVNRSRNENMKILTNYLKQGEKQLADFDKTYPEAIEQEYTSQGGGFAEGNLTAYEGPIRGTAENPELWDPELKMYRPAKRKR